MQFEELRKKIGFGLAAIVHWSELSQNQEFISGLNLTEWQAIWNQICANPEIDIDKRSFLQKIASVANTLDLWLFLCVKTPPDCIEIERQACQEMSKFSATFEVWSGIYEKYKNSHKLRSISPIAIQKMSELAKTFDQGLKIYQVAGALAVMPAMGGYLTFTGVVAENTVRIQKLGTTIMAEQAKTASQWDKLFRCTLCDEELRNLAKKNRDQLRYLGS
ncbi:hypothetical protein HOB10_04850 [Candidatus Parcubacteria bacterium]|jgi:hypothetical protein|nr:hypothetical protein [Candidatus Parcubacteria bacterium]